MINQTDLSYCNNCKQDLLWRFDHELFGPEWSGFCIMIDFYSLDEDIYYKNINFCPYCGFVLGDKP